MSEARGARAGRTNPSARSVPGTQNAEHRDAKAVAFCAGGERAEIREAEILMIAQDRQIPEFADAPIPANLAQAAAGTGAGPADSEATAADRADWHANLDLLSDPLITGWVQYGPLAQSRVRVTIYLDGHLVGSTLAAEPRPDLAQAGIGDGRYGFTLKLPPFKLHGVEHVRLVADIAGHELSLYDGDNFSRANQEDRLQQNGVTYFDITDILIWSMHHARVSGIQRVQCGYLRNVLANFAPDGDRFRFCAQQPKSQRYVKLSFDDVAAVIDSLLRGREDLFAATKLRARAIIEGDDVEAAAFSGQDTLCVLGASWIFPGYYRAIQKARQETGVRYAHVFYDAIPTVMPETCDRHLVDGFNRALAGILKYADVIYSISAYSGSDLQEIARKAGIVCPPVHVIPMGSTVTYDRPGRGARRDAVARGAIRREQNFGRFVLCVGTIEPRKNHIYLYHVWKRLIAESGLDVPTLVCVGRFGWHMDDLKRFLDATENLGGRFVVLEDVNDAQLARLYETCLFTVFPSLYEGWGLPVGESLAYGKLCVTSSVSSMPEVGGAWADYLNPLSIEDGYNTIGRLLRNPGEIAAREMEIARSYRPISWDEASQDFLERLDRFASGEAASAQLSAAPRGATDIAQIALAQEYDPTRDDGVRGVAVVTEEIKRLLFSEMLVGPDWHEIEPWGVWAMGASARIAFALPAAAHQRVLCYLRVSVPHYFGPRKCDMFVNGERIRQVTLDHHERNLRFALEGTLRASHGGADRHYTIELRLDRVVTPAEAGTGDARVLGIGIKKIFVCAANDVAARLDFLEENLV
jgi:glycosyltransferase involved in cell wall biosynthesis